MTADLPSTLQAPPASAYHSEAVAAFTRAGWTTKDWDDLYQFLNGRTDDSARRLAAWLRNSSAQFANPISPALVYDLYARHPKQTGQILRAIAAGASERFVMAFRRQRWQVGTPSAVAGWRFAASLGLNEPQATGWAETGYLHSRHDRACMDGGKPTLTESDRIALISVWTNRFGSNAWLWVLAGFTMAEVSALQQAGTVIAQDQLRVMAVLNGHTLPPGI